jgi:SET domain-containing protein
MQVKPSAKGGLGIFAAQDYPPQTKLVSFSGPILTLKQSQTGDDHEDHTLQIGPDKYIGPSGGIDDFVNHSCEPNAGLKLFGDALWLISITWILAGEELTFDYSTTIYDNDDWTMNCHCGSRNCRCIIGQFRHLSFETRKKYQQLGIDLVNRW